MPSTKAPPVKPVEAPVKEEVVTVACRAPGRTTTGCGGQRAKVLLKRKIPLGGTWIQYQCLSCNKPFQIVF